MKNVLVSTAFFLCSCFCQPVLGQALKLENKTFLKIDSLFRILYNEGNTGGAFAIMKDGDVIYSNTAGRANLEYQVPITGKTVFNIASVSKQFTTYLAFLLAEEGKLSFSDDVRDHIPELSALPYGITLQQLTNHTHGLPNVDELAFLKGAEIMTHDEIVSMLLNIKQGNFVPGDKYEYNNTGYVLLAEIIERVGGKAFEDQLKEKIFAPLGMNNSNAVGYYDEVIPNKAYSYRKIESGYIEFPVLLSTMGASGIYSSLEDLLLWANNFHNTTLGKVACLDEMRQPTILNSEQQIDYGMGLQFENYKGIDIVFHGGGTKSYRSYLLHIPDYKLSFVFLSNAGDFSGLEIVYSAVEGLLEDVIVQEKAPSSSNEADLKKLEGAYELFPGSYFNITSVQDSLFIQQVGSTDRMALPIIGKSKYRFPSIPYSHLTFYPDRFDLRIADFTYPAKRLSLPRTENLDLDLEKFIGTYSNQEHNVTYEIMKVEEQLIAKHPFNEDVPLYVFDNDSFFSPNSFLGKLDFFYAPDGEVKGFKVSGHNLDNIIFEK